MSVGAFFKKTLPGMALAVASGVPGPIGMVAGVVSKIVGKEVPADPGQINTAIEGATPDQLIALQEKDLEVKETLAKLGVDEELVNVRIAEQDRANARARQIALRDYTPPILAWLIMGATFAIIATVLLGFSKVDAAISGALIGYIVAMAQQVTGYYFGSSAGSAAKTDILAKTADGK